MTTLRIENDKIRNHRQLADKPDEDDHDDDDEKWWWAAELRVRFSTVGHVDDKDWFSNLGATKTRLHLSSQTLEYAWLADQGKLS